MDMTKQEATKALAAVINVIDAGIEEAIKIADEYSLSFQLDLGDAANVARSIGGSYYGKGNTEHDGIWYEWDSSASIEEESPEHDGFWDAWTSSGELC